MDFDELKYKAILVILVIVLMLSIGLLVQSICALLKL